MTNSKRRTWPAVVAGALGMGAALTVWAEPSQQDLMSQVNDLKAKVAALEGQQTAKVSEVSATVDSVMRDADARSQFLAAGAGGMAGHGAIAPGLPNYGFSIVMGDFTLNIGALAQIRYDLNYAKERKHGSNDTETGFEITRARLMLQGSAWDPNLTYFVQWDAGDLTGGTALLDAYAKYQVADQFGVIMGQFKEVESHEWSIADADTLGSTRSLVNGLIGVPEGTAGRVQGFGIVYGGPKDMIHAVVAYTDGLGSGNTTFTHASGVNWGVMGRVDVKISGANWDDYNTLSAKGTTDTLLVVGGGADFTQADNLNATKFTIDGQFESAGLSVFGAFLGQYAKPRNTADDSANFDWGFLLQAGYLISPQIEVFGRYDMTHFDHTQAAPADRKTFHEIAAGVNYFLGKDGAAGNNAKVTLDAAWLLKGSPTGLAYDDILGGTKKCELVARLQFQFRP